jgi:Flp pilus assembly protein TadD
VLRSDGKIEEAISELKAAIAIQKDDGEAYAQWAAIARSQGSFDDAIGLYAKSIMAEPGNPNYMFNLAMTYKDHGDKAKAKEALEAYLELAPNATDIAQVKTWIEELK